METILSSMVQTVPANDYHFVSKFIGLTFDEYNQAIRLQSGSLIKLKNNRFIWLVTNDGVKRKFNSKRQVQSYGYDLANVTTVTEEEFDKYTIGIPFYP